MHFLITCPGLLRTLSDCSGTIVRPADSVQILKCLSLVSDASQVAFSGLQHIAYAPEKQSIVAGTSPEEASMVLVALALMGDLKARLFNVGL